MELAKKVAMATGTTVSSSGFDEPKQGVDASELAEKMSGLKTGVRDYCFFDRFV